MKSILPAFTPREIVSELDRYIVGQEAAKRAVAIALRNRWRRQQLSETMSEEIVPKNILMIGSTGVGKTEIARRLAKLAQAPFIKVEATKFTEIGYVGRDVEQIIRDLMEIAISQTRDEYRKRFKAQAETKAEDRVIEALAGKTASEETCQHFRKEFREGQLDDKEIEIKVIDNPTMPALDIPGMPGAQMGMMNIGDLLGKGFGDQYTTKKMSVARAYKVLVTQESDKLIDDDKILQDATHQVEQNGIVFLDEVDKICVRSDGQQSGVSREGVQRDLLPLIEGTTVTTKHGTVKTDHILFIASGAFHVAKPSDLLPELQGRLPIRVELQPLTQSDFKRILTEPEFSLIRQYESLMGTESLSLTFSDCAIDRMAHFATHINQTVENIGARRLHTILEHLLDEISFSASDRAGETIHLTAEDVNARVESMAQNVDLSKFIL